MDASRSVRINGFRRSKEFIKNVLKGIKISQRDVHIGLIRYSSKADLIFGFEDHYTHSSIDAAIHATKYIRGGTWTHMALSLARTRLFALKPRGSSRSNIARFLILLTDGMSKDVKLTAKESTALKKEGVHIVVVAIGYRVNKSELLSIASRPEDVIRVKSFERLKNIVESVRDKVCGGTLLIFWLPIDIALSFDQDMIEYAGKILFYARAPLVRKVEKRFVKYRFRPFFSLPPPDPQASLNSFLSATKLSAMTRYTAKARKETIDRCMYLF